MAVKEDLRSPLEAIHQAELEIERRLEAARERAQAIVQEALEKARSLESQAEEEGQREAGEAFIAAARAQAAQIEASGQEEAQRIRQQGQAKISLAAQRIVEIILQHHR